jgi:SAM-dependent methyltransferase
MTSEGYTSAHAGRPRGHKRWSGSAPFWEKRREIIREMFALITEVLVEDGQIANQHAVLDISSGPGEPAFSVAALVGPEGKIFGIDLIPEMVATARRAAGHLELKMYNLMSALRTIYRFRRVQLKPLSFAPRNLAGAMADLPYTHRETSFDQCQKMGCTMAQGNTSSET